MMSTHSFIHSGLLGYDMETPMPLFVNVPPGVAGARRPRDEFMPGMPGNMLYNTNKFDGSVMPV